MRVLLVEPAYYTRYPPLGLLKLATYFRQRGHRVSFVRMNEFEEWPRIKPDKIFVTSLFTYSWRAVHRAVQAVKKRYPSAPVHLGGIYATLLPGHAQLSGADVIHRGVYAEAESVMPAYDLVPQWDGSLLFATRGCVRRCGFCAVPVLEGRPKIVGRGNIEPFVYPKHTRVILWDNNLLGTPFWRQIIDELRDLGLTVDFNQGLDARYVTEEVARRVAELDTSSIRLAFDYVSVGPAVKTAIENLAGAGVRPRHNVVYTLFNYIETPKEFLYKVRSILQWGSCSYPMRYEPLTSLWKNRFVSPHWEAAKLEMVADARRVLGYHGAFPPYEGLIKKLTQAGSFEEAFELRPMKNKDKANASKGAPTSTEAAVTPPQTIIA